MFCEALAFNITEGLKYALHASDTVRASQWKQASQLPYAAMYMLLALNAAATKRQFPKSFLVAERVSCGQKIL